MTCSWTKMNSSPADFSALAIRLISGMASTQLQFTTASSRQSAG